MHEYPLDFAEDLDMLECSNEDCNRTAHDCEIYIGARCHPGAPLWASYRAGVLSLRCAVCNLLLRAVAVAEGAAAAEGAP